MTSTCNRVTSRHDEEVVEEVLPTDTFLLLSPFIDFPLYPDSQQFLPH